MTIATLERRAADGITFQRGGTNHAIQTIQIRVGDETRVIHAENLQSTSTIFLENPGLQRRIWSGKEEGLILRHCRTSAFSRFIRRFFNN